MGADHGDVLSKFDARPFFPAGDGRQAAAIALLNAGTTSRANNSRLRVQRHGRPSRGRSGPACRTAPICSRNSSNCRVTCFRIAGDDHVVHEIIERAVGVGLLRRRASTWPRRRRGRARQVEDVLDARAERLPLASRRASSVESATNTFRATAQSDGSAVRPAAAAASRIRPPLLLQDARCESCGG